MSRNNLTDDIGILYCVFEMENGGEKMEAEVAMEVVSPLSSDEKLALKLYEGVVLAGKMSMGMALAGIRDGRLYRATHSTFEAYCKERFNMNRDYANKKIRAARVIEALDTNGIQTPSERVIRPITTLRKSDGTPDEARQREAWDKANATAREVKKKVTAKHVQRAVDRVAAIGKRKDHPELEVINASHAMWYAETAITHLRRIEHDDPKKHEAGLMVVKWCKEHLTKKEG
jgi:hypothetical protein